MSFEPSLNTPATERRRHTRYPARGSRACVEWWEEGSTRASVGQLKDISQGGAAFVAEGRPPDRQVVWVRLEEPVRSDWVQARVARIDGAEAGLEFAGECPFDFFHAASLGIDLSGCLSPEL